MSEFKVICIKDIEAYFSTDKPRFKTGYIYDCHYEKHRSKDFKGDYMEVRSADDWQNAYGEPNLSALKSHFMKINNKFKLIYYIKIKNILIQKILKKMTGKDYFKIK